MREGKTRVEAAAEMGVARTSFYDWAEKYPDFSTALIQADQLCEAWWINTARDCLESTNFKTGVWAMVMGNKFHWTNQKTSNEHTLKGGITLSDGLKKIKDQMKSNPAEEKRLLKDVVDE